jgi:hypothetical protein
MQNRRTQIGRQVASGVDLAIDFATLGEYGLEPRSADGSHRERADRRSRSHRRPGWEALATTRRGACATDVPGSAMHWRFPHASSRANVRGAVERYAA